MSLKRDNPTPPSLPSKKGKIRSKQSNKDKITIDDLNDDNSQDSVVEYDELSQQGDEKENAMIKKMQKQEEEEFSGDEEEYEEMIRKRKVIKHLGAEEDYGTKNKGNFLSKDDLEKGVDGITQFNLKEENEDGYFDGNGDFVWRKNADEEEINQDAFMREIDKVGIAKLPEKKTPEKEEKIFSQNMILVRLCSCLFDGESPMQALQRLGQSNKPKKAKTQRHKLAFEIEEEKELSPQEKEMNKKCLDLISECCSLLIEEYVNVYDMKKEELKRLVIMNYTTAKKQWEYKWQMKQDGTTGESEVFSSFNTAQMVEWHEMGCFISNPLIRRVEVKEKDDDERETNAFDENAFDENAFDAAFDEEDDKVEVKETTHPWIPADCIDYFED